MKKPIAVMTFTIFLFSFCIFIISTDACDEHSFKNFPKLKVASYNAYVGTDLPAVLAGTKDIMIAIQEVIASNYSARAAAIMKQFKRNPPDLIGLQEVYRVEIPVLGLDEPLVFDFYEELAPLLMGLGYQHVATNNLTVASVELGYGTASILDRDVVFARNGIELGEIVIEPFQARIPLPPAFGGGYLVRGFIAAEVDVDGFQCLFVNTHLEIQYPTDIIPVNIQLMQTIELMDRLNAILYDSPRPLPVVMVGDFNSLPGEQVSMEIKDNGYYDAYERRIFGRSDPGFTCCQDADLRNIRSNLYERIDYVYVRNDNEIPPVSLVVPLSVEVIGNDFRDKTRRVQNTDAHPRFSRLWPSDHAGVCATLYNPPVREDF